MHHRYPLPFSLLLAAALLSGCDAAPAPTAARPEESVVEPSRIIGRGISLAPGESGPASEAAPLRSTVSAAAAPDTTRDADSTYTDVSFEGFVDRQDLGRERIYGARFEGWRALRDFEAEGTGNFANEPTPSTVAFWICEETGDGRLCTNDRERKIVFRAPVARVAFSYAARAALRTLPLSQCTPPPRNNTGPNPCIVPLYTGVTIEAWDTVGTQHHLVDTETFDINNPDSWAGTPPGNASDGGDYRVWSSMMVSADDNRIDYVVIKGYANYLGVDNYRAVQVNHEPIASIAGPSATTEGAQVVFSGAGSFDQLLEDGGLRPGRDDVVEYLWDFGDGSPPVSRPEGTATVQHTFAQDGSYPVKLTVRDPNGVWSSQIAQRVVTVSNVLPAIAFGFSGSTVTLPAGSRVLSRSGSFQDPGDDSWTATVDWGEGAGPQPLALDADGDFELDHTFAGGGSYTVTVRVADDDAVAARSFQVVVGNSPPTLSLNPGTDIDEGSIWSSAGSFQDADTGESWSATVSWGDGSPGQPLALTPAKTFALNHVYADDGEFEVEVELTDGTYTRRIQTTATVRSVAPSGTLAPSAPSVASGAGFTLGVTGVTDPSPTDVAAGFKYAFDCGSGYGGYGTAATAACTAPVVTAATNLPVRAKVRDADGAERELTTSVAVTPPPPPPNGAPTVAVQLSPGSLWPPNHKYHTVRVTPTVTDEAPASVQLRAEIVSSEPDDAPGGGDGNTTGDIRATPLACAGAGATVLQSSPAAPTVLIPNVRCYSLELRAERSGSGPGRSYTVRVIARDAGGLESAATATVQVVHDKGK